MNEREFTNKLFTHFSNEGFVRSYKTQLRLALHKYSTENRDFSYEHFNHTLKTELICNILANYFKYYSLGNTLNVFLEESQYHKMEDSDIIENANISDIKNTYLESLISKSKRNYGHRNVETQSEAQTLEAKLAQIDENIKLNRNALKTADRQRIIHERLKQIRADKEHELHIRIKNHVESRRQIELSQAKIDAKERLRLETERLKNEFEALFLKREADFKISREHEEATTKLLEDELDRQLQRVKTGEIRPMLDDKTSVEEVKKKCNERLSRLLKKSDKIIKKREFLKKKLELEKEAHKYTLAELTSLQHKFASLKL